MDFFNTVFTNLLNVGTNATASYVTLMLLLGGAVYAASSTNERIAELGKVTMRATAIGAGLMIGAPKIYAFISAVVPH